MFLVNWLAGIPANLAVLIIAALPVGELRAALPVAITYYHIGFWEAFILSVAGNMVAALLVLLLLDPVAKFSRQHSRPIDRFLNWLFDRTRKKHSVRFEKYQALALLLFVGIPLPFTGAWTGVLATYVFGIPYKKAIPLIFLGLLISATITSIIVLSSVAAVNTIR